MKPKGRWIEKYQSEFDDSQKIENIIFDTSEILKLNVKPKVIWFVQHVLTKDMKNSKLGRCLEEGEIFSDDVEECSNHKEISHKTTGCVEIKSTINIPTNELNPIRLRRNTANYKRQNDSNSFSKDKWNRVNRRRSNKETEHQHPSLWKPYSNFHLREPLVESPRNSSY